MEAQNLNHWTAKRVPWKLFFWFLALASLWGSLGREVTWNLTQEQIGEESAQEMLASGSVMIHFVKSLPSVLLLETTLPLGSKKLPKAKY